MDTYIIELKRGTLVLAVLSQLKTPQYGYSLIETLNAHHIPIESGTLYPLLRRLEKQGLLNSTWDTQENRPRKYYVLNDQGLLTLQALTKEWHLQTEHLKEILL